MYIYALKTQVCVCVCVFYVQYWYEFNFLVCDCIRFLWLLKGRSFVSGPVWDSCACTFFDFLIHFVLESESIFRFSTTVFFFSTVCTTGSSWLVSSSKSGFGSLDHVIIAQL
jgi:hypothetical protein